MVARTSLLLGALIVIIIILVWLCGRPSHLCECMLTGVWTADQDFLDQSGLSDMYMYVEEPAGILRRTRQGYLVMVNNNGDFVSNQGFEMCYNRGWFRFGTDPYRVATVQFDFDQENFGDDAMPTLMDISLSPKNGSLVLHDADQVYACLWRDNQLSGAADAFVAVVD